MGTRHVLTALDGIFKVQSTTSGGEAWIGRRLDAIVANGQPLFMFGERAGVMSVKINGQDWFAAVRLTPDQSRPRRRWCRRTRSLPNGASRCR